MNNGAPVKEVAVHPETSAFFDLHGRSSIGRTKDLDSLINLRVFLMEAGISGFKLHYLGGFHLLLAFKDEIVAADFLLVTNLWRDWFSSLDLLVHSSLFRLTRLGLDTILHDLWSGQSLAFERIAWIKFQGVPLHLAKKKVFDDVACLFGKVVKCSQFSSRDWDLSSNIVGILVDVGARVSGQVILKWKSKRFRVWVMEELDDWVPDSLLEEVWLERSVGDGEEVHVLDSSDGEMESRDTE
ncbi:hypothetical protein Hanom_Chr07g00588121 [Helianthus anomalus]